MSFTDDVLGPAHVDLFDLIDKGLPERTYVDGTAGLIIPGKRYLVAAPKKVGKSLAFLVVAIDVALAGRRVAILDRENGADEYARRLRDVLDARRLSPQDRERAASGLRYFQYPRLKEEHGAAKDYARSFAQFDVVVFDSSRAFLTCAGVEENSTDSYASWMGALIEPLTRSGIATVILDNTGHSDDGRARGSSSKGDLNEVMISVSVESPFGLDRAGSLRLQVDHSRFADVSGAWSIPLGAGRYGPMVKAAGGAELGQRVNDLDQRIVEYVAEHSPCSANAIEKALIGARETILGAVRRLVDDDVLTRSGKGIGPGDRFARFRTSSEPPHTASGSEVPALRAGNHGEPLAGCEGDDSSLTADELVDALLDDPDLGAVEVDPVDDESFWGAP